MIRTVLLASAAVASTISVQPAFAATAKPKTAASTASSNPFAKVSSLPFQAPDFSKIKSRDYLPALLAGMAQQKREVLAIANQLAPPSFGNTVVAMERSGELLTRANMAFQAVNGANTDDVLQATDTKTAPLLAAHNDFIYLNQKLFQQFKALYERQAELKLTPEQAKLLDVYYNQFVHSGAQLTPAQQAQLKTINERLSTLQTQFNQKLLPQPRRARCMSLIPQPLRACRRSNSRPLKATQKIAMSRATCSRCRTRPSSRCCQI